MLREGPFFIAFGRRLSAGKAMLFYLVWFLNVHVIGLVLGAVVAIAKGKALDQSAGLRIMLMAATAVACCCVLAIVILAARRLWRRAGALALAFAAPAGAALCGVLTGPWGPWGRLWGPLGLWYGCALVGLIPVAFMTTLQPDDGANNVPPEMKTF